MRIPPKVFIVKVYMVSASDNSRCGPLKVMYLKGNESKFMENGRTNYINTRVSIAL